MAEQTESEAFDSAADAAEFDHELYSQVTVAARLRDIKLIKSEYSIKPEVFEALDDLENMGFFGEPTGFFFSDDEGVLLGNYQWTCEIKLGRKKVLKFVCEYMIAYSGLNGFEEEYVRFYFEKVGRFATYPYFRSDFSHHVSSSGILLPPLPSLNERVN